MTVSTNSGFQTAAASPAYGVLNLVELQFRDGTLRLTTWPTPIQALGQTWNAAGALGTVGELHESEDGAEEKVTLSLTLADESMRALALSDPATYQDRPVRIWVCLLDAQTLQPSGSPVLRFAGVMDQIRVERDDDNGKIVMDCRSATYGALARRGYPRMTNAQHQSYYPAERGFEYLTSLIGNPAVWASKKFQEKKARG